MKTTLIKNIFKFSLVATALTYAANNTDMNKKEIKTYTTCYTEDCMSITQLQKEVERLSVEGKLPFEMGLELIKRWSKQS